MFQWENTWNKWKKVSKEIKIIYEDQIEILKQKNNRKK